MVSNQSLLIAVVCTSFYQNSQVARATHSCSSHTCSRHDERKCGATSFASNGSVFGAFVPSPVRRWGRRIRPRNFLFEETASISCLIKGQKQTQETAIPSLLVRMSSSDQETGIDIESLCGMDIVLFSRRGNTSDNENDSSTSVLELGAIQDDGTLAPISTWTLEDVMVGSLEFLVDEEDLWLPELTPDKVVIRKVVDENVISYGSRQVGGGMGPGNPHGEESEQLYYVERGYLEKEGVKPVWKPELEIFW